jgi:hypothetical protein
MLARHAHTLPAALLALATVFALSACGGAPSGSVAVRIGGDSITKAALAHWTTVEAIRSFNNSPSQAPPSGVVPDPPHYRACIAYLAKTVPSTSAAQLRSQCQQRYTLLRDRVLGILITYDWLKDEAAHQDITVGEAQVTGMLDSEFPTRTSLHTFLSLTDETESEQRLVVKRTLLDAALLRSVEGRLPKDATAVQKERAEIEAFRALTRKWTSLTSCSPGYVVPQCKEYKGPPEETTY